MITTITEAGRGVLASREHTMDERTTTAFRDGFDASERRQLTAVIPLLERFANDRRTASGRSALTPRRASRHRYRVKRRTAPSGK